MNRGFAVAIAALLLCAPQLAFAEIVQKSVTVQQAAPVDAAQPKAKAKKKKVVKQSGDKPKADATDAKKAEEPAAKPKEKKAEEKASPKAEPAKPKGIQAKVKAEEPTTKAANEDAAPPEPQDDTPPAKPKKEKAQEKATPKAEVAKPKDVQVKGKAEKAKAEDEDATPPEPQDDAPPAKPKKEKVAQKSEPEAPKPRIKSEEPALVGVTFAPGKAVYERREGADGKDPEERYDATVLTCDKAKRMVTVQLPIPLRGDKGRPPPGLRPKLSGYDVPFTFGNQSTTRETKVINITDAKASLKQALQFTLSPDESFFAALTNLGGQDAAGVTFAANTYGVPKSAELAQFKKFCGF